MVIDPDLGSLTAVAVYAVLWGFIFAECGLLLGFLLPGDTILFGAGLLAAAPDSEISLPLLIAGTFIAAVAGNEVGYLTGRRYGRSWIENRETGRALEQLRRTERFYERWGWMAIVVARWIPWVRTFTPLVAGAAVMDRRAFTSANVVGALPWAVGLPLLGYFAYQLPVLRSISYAVAIVAILGTGVGAVIVVRRDRAARHSARAAAAGHRAADDPPAAAGDTATDESG
jgi:membrane-associated protein